MGTFEEQVKKALYSTKPGVRSQLLEIQKKTINVETKLMFEKDKNTKKKLKEQLTQLNKKRWEIIHACN